MRSVTAVISALALGALACGARSDLAAERPLDAPATPDAATMDAAIPDAATPDASAPDASAPAPAWTEGVWWFGTVRAVCDTFAVEFCGGGEVAARWSRDDGCFGENPTTAEPIRGRMVSASVDVVTLRFDLPPGALEPETVRLRAGAAVPVESLALDFEPGSGFIEFPWGQGRRPDDLGVPPMVVRSFVRCE